MKKIKAVIFDLDGTLANTLPLCIRSFRESVQPLINRQISDGDIMATFGPSEEGTIMALAPDHYQMGISHYLRYYKAFHEMCPAPFDGIPELLMLLQDKNIETTMVTGKGFHSTVISLEYLKLERFFNFIETGSPAGPRKADGIQAILNALPGIKKDEFIYVGDAPGDIIASRKVGIPVVAAAWAETAEPELLKRHEPDHLFYAVADFSTWLSKHL
ncbi:HAD family hydrolase [Mucilaginibacter sp. SP1R1]|uniref:HAD family hydrolase n=1 Tax=Mucilaginibacter sp. SP1R1 TaxID=2723091 RepID=UPI0016208C60|nr:HAD hydrolase-like protein [Mucilaginibacter sp. SP1R1]MBB6152359.1 phosphoglycolate phosphatase/pyrophosphatase PpaX [Mucilaginibacter sp. SP1R1]